MAFDEGHSLHHCHNAVLFWVIPQATKLSYIFIAFLTQVTQSDDFRLKWDFTQQNQKDLQLDFDSNTSESLLHLDFSFLTWNELISFPSPKIKKMIL